MAASMVCLFRTNIYRITASLQPCRHRSLLDSCYESNSQCQAYRFSTHWVPKWKALRKMKTVHIKLPDFDSMRKSKDQLTPEEIRLKTKEKGISPPRPWNERQMLISCTGEIVDKYVPPEGDGKLSALTYSGAKQQVTKLDKKRKSMAAVRKIKDYDDDFEHKEFGQVAHDIYVNVHEALSERDDDKLYELVTEKCYPEMMENVKLKTVRWKFIKSLEPPRVTQVRTVDMLSRENVYAQITVRFHTQQTLAVYDRFGRLHHGSEVVAKDVLEYLVFEKHLSSLYGSWRLHGKIIPDWMPIPDPIKLTFRKPEEPELPAEPTKKLESAEKDIQEDDEDTTATPPKVAVAGDGSKPQLAT